MTGEEQFAVFNSSAWLTAFRVQVNNVQTALASYATIADQISFQVEGVPCAVQVISGTEAWAHIGTDDSGNWQYSLRVPINWFTPPT